MEVSEEPGVPWLTTFCDLVFLLLTFFVLQFATTVAKPPPVDEAEPAAVPEKQPGGETYIVTGAFSPSDSDELSFRGRTAIQAVARQAAQLGRDVKVALRVVELGGESHPEALLHRQRMSVVRQFQRAGLPKGALRFIPIFGGVSHEDRVQKGANSLTSRLELTIQEKRS